MIPKIVHYCWFGGQEKPDEVKQCIASWRKYLPGWEICEWNETNFDIDRYLYTKEAYALKKWAFVSDVARLQILYENGGIYLDVDVEFIKPFPEEYLRYEGICGFEHTATIAPGLLFGIQKGHPFMKTLLDSYQNEEFRIPLDGIYKTINMRITEALEQRGLKKNNQLQTVDGIRIFPSEYFCGYDTDIREPDITSNTICWHHYMGSWQKTPLKAKVQRVLKKCIGIKQYRNLLMLKRMICDTRKEK